MAKQLILILISVLAFARAQSVRKLYFDEIAQGFQNEKFRTELRQELEKVGFKFVEEPSLADAVLRGHMSAWGERGGTFTATLENPTGGRILWQKKFDRTIRLGKTRCESRDTATLLAQRVARGVRAWAK